MKGLKFKPLTEYNWNDLEVLFGEKGACGGCWCMYWRLSARQYNEGKGNKNKQALKKLLETGSPLGLLAYIKNKPIGWCSVSPSSSLKRLETSRLFKPKDLSPENWAITCFYIHKNFRKSGLTGLFIYEAIKFAQTHGARNIEAYPVIPKSDSVPAVFAWTGFLNPFIKAGFNIIKATTSRAHVIFSKS